MKKIAMSVAASIPVMRSLPVLAARSGSTKMVRRGDADSAGL